MSKPENQLIRIDQNSQKQVSRQQSTSVNSVNREALQLAKKGSLKEAILLLEGIPSSHHNRKSSALHYVPLHFPINV